MSVAQVRAGDVVQVASLRGYPTFVLAVSPVDGRVMLHTDLGRVIVEPQALVACTPAQCGA